MPETKKHDRLVRLAQPHHDKVDELIKRMWSIPATTPEGRQAKFLVLLNFVLAGHWSVQDGDWREGDWAADWHIRMTRYLLIEFMPDRRSWRIAPPSSPISALSLSIFRGRSSSTATLGTLDRFWVHRPVVRLTPFLDIQHALMAVKGVPLANETDHLSPQIHQT
jgi:hypothetical protein